MQISTAESLIFTPVTFITWCRPAEPVNVSAAGRWQLFRIKSHIFEYSNITRSMNSPLHVYKAEFFKTLGHSVRLAILDALRDGPLSVTELQAVIQADQSILSQHLAKLRVMKFVSSRRERTTIYYDVPDREIYQFLDLARNIYVRQLRQSEEMLKELAPSEG